MTQFQVFMRVSEGLGVLVKNYSLILKQRNFKKKSENRLHSKTFFGYFEGKLFHQATRMLLAKAFFRHQ